MSIRQFNQRLRIKRPLSFRLREKVALGFGKQSHEHIIDVGANRQVEVDDFRRKWLLFFLVEIGELARQWLFLGKIVPETPGYGPFVAPPTVLGASLFQSGGP